MATQDTQQKILILATETCAYPGANAVGQAHMSYPTNTYILRVRSPVLFPEKFYLDCFAKGIGGIIIMSCGEECPYEGAYHALAARIDRVYQMMICTVCTRAFVKEVNNMNQILAELGPPGSEKATVSTRH